MVKKDSQLQKSVIVWKFICLFIEASLIMTEARGEMQLQKLWISNTDSGVGKSCKRTEKLADCFSRVLWISP